MVEFFGVRHHSPTAARLVRRRILDHPPAALLVEGPTEFTAHLDEMVLDHRLPIMIYTWAPMFPDAPESSSQAAVRRGGFYPLTDFSPEWVALRTAHECGVPTEFIDLPWLAFADIAVAENRWAEPATAEKATERLRQEFGVDDTDALFDELLEIDPGLGYESYQERIRMLGTLLRGEPDPETQAREAHMAYRIDLARDRHGDDLLVVCGAAHVDGLGQLLQAGPEPVDTWLPPPDDERYGIALTPTSYAALDALDGYDAGQPTPGFYDQLYRDRDQGRHDTAQRLLGVVIESLRKAGRQISPADLMGVQVTAAGLARLRGHPQIWRTDLLEAITSALVKDDRGDEHPLLARVRLMLRGDRVGQLAKGSRQPPLTRQLRTRLEALALVPQPRPREELADLTTDEGLARSCLLHSVTVLQIPGFRWTGKADADGIERWSLQWSTGYEAGLVQAARFGGTIEQAVAQSLLARAADIVSDPAAACELVLEAALCGIAQLPTSLHARTETLLATAASLPPLGQAVGVLMQLYRYDPILRATGRADLGRLLTTSFHRAIRLLERLVPLPEGPALESFITAMRHLADCAERVGEHLGFDIPGFHQALTAVMADDCQAATVRGCALGAQWLAEARPDSQIAEAMSVIAVPEQLGDFVAGLLGVAREAALRRPAALLRLDEILTACDQDAFFAALPGLRRAFSGYPPRERAQVADLVLGEQATVALARFSGTAAEAYQIAGFEAAVSANMERFLGAGHG